MPPESAELDEHDDGEPERGEVRQRHRRDQVQRRDQRPHDQREQHPDDDDRDRDDVRQVAVGDRADVVQRGCLAGDAVVGGVQGRHHRLRLGPDRGDRVERRRGGRVARRQRRLELDRLAVRRHELLRRPVQLVRLRPLGGRDPGLGDRGRHRRRRGRQRPRAEQRVQLRVLGGREAGAADRVERSGHPGEHLDAFAAARSPPRSRRRRPRPASTACRRGWSGWPRWTGSTCSAGRCPRRNRFPREPRWCRRTRRSGTR